MKLVFVIKLYLGEFIITRKFQNIKNIKISLKSKELVITVESFEDISLEQALFEKETLSFEQVFSLKPVLKEKRVYDYVNKGDGGV